MSHQEDRAAPKVTALIDTYNQGRFIEEAIESVLAQDFPQEQMEIVVVDDGSTDDTAERVKRFGDRIRYFRKENGGQASALNFGFAQARGEIVAMLDGDDVWLPQKVRRVVEELEMNPHAVMACHPYQIWDIEQGLCWNDPNFYLTTGFVPGRLADLLQFGGFGTCGMAIRRMALDQVLPIPQGLTVLADSYLVWTIPFLGHVVGLNEHLTKYRHHGQNLTSFSGTDSVRARLRADCGWINAREAEAWLRRHGHSLERPEIAAFVKRLKLIARYAGFMSKSPSRGELAGFLQDYRELYGSFWTHRYRFFHRLTSAAAFLLGYDRFESLRDRYRHLSRLPRLREFVIPHKPASRWAAS